MTNTTAIQRIKTTSGNTPIDYETLANLPVPDKSLEGGMNKEYGFFADAKATGDRLSSLEDILRDGNDLTQKNLIQEINIINNIISDSNGHGKRISDNEVNISQNKKDISSNAKKIAQIEEAISDDTGLGKRINDLTYAYYGFIKIVTDWNDAKDSGTYYADEGVILNSPIISADKSDTSSQQNNYVQYGYVQSYVLNGEYIYVHQTVHIVRKQGVEQGTAYTKAERYFSYDSNAWSDWADATPLYESITQEDIDSVFSSTLKAPQS